MAALAGDLESDIVGSVALDLDGPGGHVVEILVEKLYAKSRLVDKLEGVGIVGARSPKGHWELALDERKLFGSEKTASPGTSCTHIVGRLADICEGWDGLRWLAHHICWERNGGLAIVCRHWDRHVDWCT